MLKDSLKRKLLAYAQSEGTTLQAGLRDFLTDLRHLADKLSLDFEDAVVGSEASYNEEISFFVVHRKTGETMKDEFASESDAYRWLKNACKNGKVVPACIDEYAIEKAEL